MAFTLIFNSFKCTHSKILIEEKLMAGSGFGQILRRDSGFGQILRRDSGFGQILRRNAGFGILGDSPPPPSSLESQYRI